MLAIPRSVRNNNPGNLRKGASWQGMCSPLHMTPMQESEHEFCVFVAPKWGFRAMGLLLENYGHDGLETVPKIIARFAPSTENDTAAYAAHVCELTGFGAEQSLDLADRATLSALCKAIATDETGSWLPWWKDADLAAGVALMGPA